MAEPVPPPPQIGVDTCERLVSAATRQCDPGPPAPPAPPAQLDGVEATLASLGVAIAWGAFIIAILALGGVIAWALYVRHWTKIAAAEEAQTAVPIAVRDYLDGKLHAMVAEAMAPLIASSQAEQQAKELGEESP